MNSSKVSLILLLAAMGCGSGADGKDGTAGADGADGADGIDGADGADGEDGIDCWDTNGNGEADEDEDANGDGEINAADCAGADGANGEEGAPGADGADGTPGADGEDGAPGADGADGEDGAPGSDGADGAPGADGADGAPGADGEDAYCYGVDPLEFLEGGVIVAGTVVEGEEQTFTANLNDTGLEVDLAFLDLDVYTYTSGTSFSAIFEAEGTVSFVILATDGCSFAMSTVSVDVAGATTFVDSYTVQSGPIWSSSPSTYSCVEACAFLFGGDAGSYQCSTEPDVINNLSYHSVYGVSGCATEPDTYKNGTFYNFSGASSAFVEDNCTSGTLNYCFID